ncbi:hypothetical protein QFC22_003185 [Naganishia vaughanmartiniae]|uniref:Uncharacterized protein n=1 Tax=Naganishia vaughanmartiniae TaxID=1424756 RepID=A0ACC2XA71_9TREE|nr:hypothetical protein QFC22_003185 [Naganishia vaughanmartiniae]
MISLSLMSTPKSPQPALSRTPGRLESPPSRKLGAVPNTQTSPSGLPKQFDGLSQGQNGRNSIAASTDQSDTTSDRRSFFGRLFKPSTDNLRTSGVGSSVPAPSLSRHGRHQSQQSIASTAETYTEDSEVDDATDSRRRERNKRVLMGRSVPSAKRDDAARTEEKKGVPRVHVHAPIPNPRRTASGSSVAGRHGRDERELSVIEDEDVEDSGDVAVDGMTMIDSGAAEERIDALEQDQVSETVPDTSIINSPSAAIQNSPTSLFAPLGPDNSNDEGDEVTSSNSLPEESTSPPSITVPQVPVAKTQTSRKQDERDEEDADREMPIAPSSPSVEHELVTISDSSRRK